MRILSTVLALAVLAFCGQFGLAETIIGYDIVGGSAGATTVSEISPNAVGKTFSSNAFGFTNFNVGGGSDLVLSPVAPASNSNVLSFGFDAVGGVWEIDEIDFAIGNFGDSHTFDLRVTVNGSTTTDLATGFGPGIREITGIGLTNVTSALFELELSNNESADFFLNGNTYDASGFTAGTNLGIAGNFTAVPEPTAVGCLMLALGAVGFRRQRA